MEGTLSARRPIHNGSGDKLHQVFMSASWQLALLFIYYEKKLFPYRFRKTQKYGAAFGCGEKRAPQIFAP